jgi:hypothetical protein
MLRQQVRVVKAVKSKVVKAKSDKVVKIASS